MAHRKADVHTCTTCDRTRTGPRAGTARGYLSKSASHIFLRRPSVDDLEEMADAYVDVMVNLAEEAAELCP